MASSESEPNLRNPQPGERLYDASRTVQQGADAIAIEQRREVAVIRAALADRFTDVADRIVKGLAPEDVWEYFAVIQGETQAAKTFPIRELERGGTWKLAGVTAIGHPANTADLTVQLSRLTPGIDLRVTAKRTDPAEVTVNLPLQTLDGSFDVLTAGGAAADKVLLYLHLQRTGARLGGGTL